MEIVIISFSSIFLLILSWIGYGLITDKKFGFIKFLNKINSSYKTVFEQQNKIIQILIILFFISFIVSLGSNGYSISTNYTNNKFNVITILIALFFFLVCSIIIFFMFGIPLVILLEVSKYINNLKNNNLSNSYFISFFISFFLLAYILLLKIYNVESKICYYIILVPLIITYMLNIKNLICIVSNPSIFFLKEDEENIGDNNKVLNRPNIYIIGAILLLSLILLNLILGVYTIYSLDNNAFLATYANGKITIWDLVYFSLITFITVGYGDIVPITPIAKLMSMIIAFTSVMCLGIFVNSILSTKENLFKTN